jgi:flavin reductase (DIM6/NTAB) family NADH-FMN oxidoreductase RutF
MSHPTLLAPLPSDTRHLRDCLGAFATGVTIMSAKAADGGFVGLTANSFSALSLQPPLILWSLKRSARSLPVFIEQPHFVVNVLSADQLDLAKRFASASTERFAGVAITQGEFGAPLIEGALAWLECVTRSRHEHGDHVLFIAEVLRCNHTAQQPLVFSQGQFMFPSRLPATT